MDQRSIIAITQLINTIHTPDQDKHDRQTQERHEGLEPRRDQAYAPASRSVTFDLCDTSPAREPDRIIDGQDDEQRESKHLKGQTGERNVDADIGLPSRVGGHAAAGRLQGERDDVAGDEDVIVRGRGKAGVLGAKVVDAVKSS